MNYPVWYIPSIGGAILIAVMAIVHVVISHFAVGGGLWLVWTERKAYRENKDYMVDYVKSHALFFMLLTLVMGSMTGVGIWFTIALISPDATSALIHNFVFGWSIEWVFFVIEIATAFLYYYTFKKISRATHLLIGWIYFIAAWASLLVINGIITFMMTPGHWLETRNFWQGIFNPTYWPSTVFRTFLSFALAGGYALLTASRKYSGAERTELVRYNGKWIAVSIAGMIPSLLWYYFTIPATARAGLGGASPIMNTSLIHLVVSLVVLILLVLIVVWWKAEKVSMTWSLVVLVVLFVFFGAFEFIREAGRKPYIIKDYMYSNGMTVSQVREMQGQSVLQTAKWSRYKEIDDGNKLAAGEDLFRIQCSACHTIGFKNDITGTIKDWHQKRIVGIIGNLNGMTPFMPAFVGTEGEREALGAWLFHITHPGVEPGTEVPPPAKSPASVDGKQVFDNYCSLCHELDGENAMRPKMVKYKGYEAVFDMLGRLEQINEDMPAFEGTEEERRALAQYLAQLHQSGGN